jgi:hypothetical protein
MRRRTQVLLDDRQYDFLHRERARTGLSIGELVRRAVDATYEVDRRPTVRGFDVSFGLWRRPDAAVIGRRPPRL